MDTTHPARRSRSFPTLSLLFAPFRWIGASRRRIWVAVLLLLATIACPVIWWWTQLLGLPDIGDPFDVAAFRAFKIPDDRNAFVLYRQAARSLKPWGRGQSDKINRYSRLVRANPEIERWVEDNREAMELFRQGTERPDALDRIPEIEHAQTDDLNVLQALGSFRVLALLKGSRLEDQGDLAGAWAWYRAALCAILHVGLRASVIERQIARRWYNEIQDHVASWAADPRTTPALLRQALEDVIACESLAPSDSYTLKAQYFEVDRILDDLNRQGRRMPPSWAAAIGMIDYHLARELLDPVYRAWRFWRREHERSRRVIRLALANWIAYYDLPPEDRPEPDPNTLTAFDFYAFGPDAPANARILSPRSLDRWLGSTTDAGLLLGFWGWSGIRLRERLDHGDLLILLATQLYRRDHGTDPPTPEALVGPYLKSLPEEFPDNRRDDTAPVAGAPETSQP